MSQAALDNGPATAAARKARVAELKTRIRALFDSGAPGLQLGTALCEGSERLFLELVEQVAASRSDAVARDLPSGGAILAVGGTGRGEVCPYSDLDILFLDAGVSPHFREFASAVSQACWDGGLKISQSIRTLDDAVSFAGQDPPFCTSLVEARHLWGLQSLSDKLIRQFRTKLIDRRRRAFIQSVAASRKEEWEKTGAGIQELQPNVKTSLGGLRDIHLIRWVGQAAAGARDLDSLRLKGVISKDESRELKDAWDFLTRIRFDLHFEAGRAQDILTRDDQLRISGDDGSYEVAHMRPVEQFMQRYFRHTTKVASIARRFVRRNLPPSLFSATRNLLLGHRADGVLRVSDHGVDVRTKDLPRVTESLTSMMRAYRLAAMHGVEVSAQIEEAIKLRVPALAGAAISRETASLFLDVMRYPKALGPLLRSLFETELLDALIPDVTHVRCLLQFNQYHSYTVDEHTLRAMEIISSFETDQGPLGAAYRSIRRKEVVHLAMLLHDVGKGFEEDHSKVGRDIAERIGERLFLPREQTEQVMLLVLRHLDMAHIAQRRDITDMNLMINFARQVGTHENLTMLYVLTAADITAVGPGVWNEWKAELLDEVYDRCSVILTGCHEEFHQTERMKKVRDQVIQILAPEEDPVPAWIQEQLSQCTAYYLTSTSAEQVAADLKVLQSLDDRAIEVTGKYDPQTGTVDYRVFTRNPVATTGCFHKMAGVLTAKRMEILAANINTTGQGVVVDGFRVKDRDYEGEVPTHRIREVAMSLRDVLLGHTTVEELFKKHRRFGERRRPPVSNLPNMVKLDRDSTDDKLIIDVFAHDAPGLLYTVTRGIFDLGLSIDLAKISTHFDQVLDVFYVRESNGRPVQGDERRNDILETMSGHLKDFESGGHKKFLV
jgi:[protein-PII] uridylyltransferase